MLGQAGLHYLSVYHAMIMFVIIIMPCAFSFTHIILAAIICYLWLYSHNAGKELFSTKLRQIRGALRMLLGIFLPNFIEKSLRLKSNKNLHVIASYLPYIPRSILQALML